MQMTPTTRNTLTWAIRILAAGLFILSAVAKMFPISAFEMDLVQKGITGWELAPFLSRALIGFELFLGLAFLQPHYLRKGVVPAAIALLAAFCIYLVYSIAVTGNSGNCGCFGQLIPMSPLEALIKNIITIGLLVWLYVLLPKVNQGRFAIPFIGALAIFGLMFIITPYQAYNTLPSADEGDPNRPGLDTSFTIVTTKTPAADTFEMVTPTKEDGVTTKPEIEHSKKGDDGHKTTSPINIPNTPKPDPIAKAKPSVFAKFTDFSTGRVNLDEGDKIVALLNLDCDHCIAAAKKMAESPVRSVFPPVYALFMGEKTEVPGFNKSTGTNFPYIIIDPYTFFPMLEDAPSPPRIVYLRNGKIIGDWKGDEFDPNEVAALATSK